MTRDQFNDLDGWLAAQDAAGVRFRNYREIQEQAGRTEHCAMAMYTEERTGSAMNLPECMRDTGLDGHVSVALFTANDASDGSPAAVRAELHRLFPEYVEPARAPAETPQLHAHREGQR